MKTKIILPVVLVTIICVLGGLLAHEVVLRHRAARGQLEFETAVFVQLYQNLDRGQVDAAKQRLGALVTVQSEAYEKYFGEHTDANFAPMLSQANTIKAEFEASK